MPTTIHSEYLYSASLSPLLLRDAPDYNMDSESELTHRSATGHWEWRACPRSIRDGVKWDSNLPSSGRKAPNLPLSHHVPCTMQYNRIVLYCILIMI